MSYKQACFSIILLTFLQILHSKNSSPGKLFSDRVKKAAALENISQEMNVAGWYSTHHNASLGTKTRLTCFALIGCTLFNWFTCIADRRRQLSCVGEGVYSDATQLNLTLRRVEFSCVTCVASL